MTWTVFCRALAVGVLLVLLSPREALAQTPSPLAEWQFSAGEVLAPLGGPIPDWRVVLGLGAGVQPDFMGAKRYQPTPAGIIDIRYRDVAFLSDGEGLGVNLIHGKGYRAGVAISYDLGRNHSDDPRLQGLADVSAAPEAKAFAEYFLKAVVLTADVRRGLGGHNGVIGDLGAYVPLPVAKNTFLFTGPDVTFANGHYMNAYFGVDPPHSVTSGLPQFDAGGGLRNASLGATLVYLFGKHGLVNADMAFQRLLGAAEDSPITQTRTQFTADLIIGYRF